MEGTDATALTMMMSSAVGAKNSSAGFDDVDGCGNGQDGGEQQQQQQQQQSKTIRAALLRDVLPACQPQEGSPANTFTDSELQELQTAFENILKRSDQKRMEGDGSPAAAAASRNDVKRNEGGGGGLNEAAKMDILECASWSAPPPLAPKEAPPQQPKLDWHGAPNFDVMKIAEPRTFRQMVREGNFVGPTNAVCPGYLQCNLVVLPQGQHAFDFLLFCQRNPQACPLIEVCDVGSHVPAAVAPTADLRTDCPKYAIYKDGKLEKEVTDVTEYWPENSVAFLIGCSFSYDGELMDCNVPLRSVEQRKNVPMYKTNIKCRPAGSLSGNMVVSMKPIPSMLISKHVEITSKYAHAHGGPVCVGSPECIGIADVHNPEWGDAVQMHPHDICVFHACGVTPQSVLMDSKVPYAITHSAGHMFVTDLPSTMKW